MYIYYLYSNLTADIQLESEMWSKNNNKRATVNVG